jgi:hypothetical protein
MLDRPSFMQELRAHRAADLEELRDCRELAEAHLCQLRAAVADACNIVVGTREVINSTWEAIRAAEAIRRWR